MKWWLSSQSKSEKAAPTAVIWFQPHTPTAGLNAKFGFFKLQLFVRLCTLCLRRHHKHWLHIPSQVAFVLAHFCKRIKISESIFIVYQLNRLWLYTFCREIQCIIFRKSGGIFFSQTELFFIQVVFVQQPSGFPKAHRVMFFWGGKSKAFYFTKL